MKEPLINKETGQVVTRIVKAQHRDIRRAVVLRRTGEVVDILAHDYNPALHEALPAGASHERVAKPIKKKATKKKATKNKTKKAE
jgi:hypothetical protein